MASSTFSGSASESGVSYPLRSAVGLCVGGRGLASPEVGPTSLVEGTKWSTIDDPGIWCTPAALKGLSEGA
jgi:hypothetical protein